MKFTFKLIISITTMIAVIFSIAGIIMINKNFTYSLETRVNQNIEVYLLERYGIEENIVNHLANNQEISKEKLIQYVKTLNSYLGNRKKFSVYLEGSKIYSNIEDTIIKEDLDFLLGTNELKYNIKESNNNQAMFVSSTLEIDEQKVTYLSKYDITDVFAERDRQLLHFYMIDFGIVVASTILVSILSIFLTKPIRNLNEMSKKISKGLYTERIPIVSNDEIGELSQSFNVMIDTIESKIGELELSVQQREEFVSNFTHELKTPMTSIIGYSDLLRSNQYSQEMKKKAAEYIFSEAKRLEILSHKLMDLMELSKESIQLEKVEIVPFVQQIKEKLEESLGNITLELEMEDGFVIADKDLLEDCLRNLIENAKKAKPKDDKITILGQKQKDQYKIAVVDKGCGIEKKDLPRITESFYMVDKTRAKSEGGSGIGLAICEKIAKLHGSKLQFESEVGKGTTVSFELGGWKDESKSNSD